MNDLLKKSINEAARNSSKINTIIKTGKSNGISLGYAN